VPRTISLAAYAVKIWNPSDGDYEYLSNFDGEGSDLLDFMREVLTAIKTKTLDEEAIQHALSVAKLEEGERRLSGTIRTGAYGFESDLINRKTSKLSYKRTKDDAEMLPFYFQCDVPEGVEDGILILQRTATFGIRKVVHWVLDTAFSNKHPEFKLHLQPLVPEAEVNKFIKGKVQKIHFIRKGIPADLADAYDKGHKAVPGTMELVVKARKGSNLPLNSFVNRVFKSKEVGSILALGGGEKFSYENVKVQVKVGRATRTVNAAAPERIRSYFDITEQVTIGRDGHPEYNSLKEEAEKLSAELRAVFYGAA